MSKIRVLLTDDHTLFRQGIHTLLAEESDIDVVGEAANGTESVEQIGTLRPDVVLMDIGMPDCQVSKRLARSRNFVLKQRFCS